jgi:hypothetical protein
MPHYFPAQSRVNPSFAEPDMIVTYAQPSGAFWSLPEGKPRTKIGSEDLFVYVNSIDLRTETQVSQSYGNFLPSATLVGSYNSTPTYRIRTRAMYDHHDIAAASMYSVSLPAAQDYACRQGIFQQMRTMLLYGFNPSNGEGLLNATDAVQVTLPPDSYGNSTVQTYDNGEMALFLLDQVKSILIGMYQLNTKVKTKVVFVGPQRIFGQFALTNVVQVTSYQRPGAGTSTTAQMLGNVALDSNIEVEWHYDDTLIGQGAGGTDALIMTVPEIEVPSIPGINTNEFGKLEPSMKAVNVMYTDMAAPMKISTPIPDGGITDVHELRCTSGWNLRGQGLYVLNMPY